MPKILHWKLCYSHLINFTYYLHLHFLHYCSNYETECEIYYKVKIKYKLTVNLLMKVNPKEFCTEKNLP